MNITEDFIRSVSANEAAVKNGMDLVKKKSFTRLTVDENKTLIGGECLGSGKKPYICSADFINESAPVFRCTCPSRQIPCKHVIGLLWAYMEGHEFTIAEISEDIIAKRENKEKRTKKAKEKPEGSPKEAPKEKSAAWKRSAVKKIDAQLTGLAEAEKILRGIVQTGLGAMDVKNINSYAAITKQLDSYFIPGIQDEINDLLGEIRYNNDGNKKEYANYMAVTEKICRIHTLLSRSKTYLESKKEKPDQPDIESEIEELMGYPWKLEELAQQGLLESNVKLVELCFHVRREDDKKRFVEEGFYISLNSGAIYKTRNYRPFKAAKHIKEQDSIFSVLNIQTLYIYPSTALNPRVRWEENAFDMFERVTPEVCKQIKSHAHSDYSEVLKAVKNQIKNLLLFPHPVLLVKFSLIEKISPQENAGEMYSLSDLSGNKIILKKSAYCQGDFIFLLNKLTRAEVENNAMLLLFDNDIQEGVLFAQPLALITDEKIIRLLY